ncbi:hypothetical protein [Rhodococcus opacus]|uniref:hypothetical protein n=1 Tax=Rhodococcus opacus TaxID=37919 RepID=UPI0029550E45|nr:hypothetical protein [Rhodococcus opacus]
MAIVCYDEADEYPYIVSIDSRGEVGERRVDALTLFERLRATPWALLLTPDEGDVRQERRAPPRRG